MRSSHRRITEVGFQRKFAVDPVNRWPDLRNENEAITPQHGSFGNNLMIPDDLVTNFHTCIENGCTFSVLFWAASGGIWKTEQFIDGLLCGKLNARGAHSVGKTLWWKLPIREFLAQYPLNLFLLMNTGRVDTGSGVRTRIWRVATMKGSYPVACGRSSSLARTRRVCLVLIVVTHNITSK